MTDSQIPWFRELYDDILQYRRYSLYYDVLVPWTQRAQAAVGEMARFKTFSLYDPTDEAAQQSMWNLYALSRVNDFLLTSFQNGYEPKHATVTLEEYESFFTGIGFNVVASERFAPFHHEIVKVHATDANEETVQLYDTLWPELMFGDMMFSRSGVEVVGGRNHILKEVAEQSTLYFTYMRGGRQTYDLSIGWGSNSQWRTRFRRDYQVGKLLVYNSDGKNDLTTNSSEDRDGLTRQERIELCKHRCFVYTRMEDQDLWPYDDRFEEEMCA